MTEPSGGGLSCPSPRFDRTDLISRLHLLTVLFTGVLALTGTALPATGPAGAAAGSQSQTDGGDTTCAVPNALANDASQWQCTFDDEFDGTTLDTTKWSVWDDVNYFNQPGVCYYSGPDNVAVSGGTLRLSVTRLPSPQICPTPYGRRVVRYGAGVVYTQGHFSQTYGMFAARIKFAGGRGLHDAFWMYPEANNYPGHAEIDVAEPWGARPNTVYASTHITGLNDAYLSRTGACAVDDWAADFHTYWMKWSSTAITFGVDGDTCSTVTNWTPLAGFVPSAPFNQPFYLILEDLVDNGFYSPAPDSSTVFPATTEVDWVRAWK